MCFTQLAGVIGESTVTETGTTAPFSAMSGTSSLMAAEPSLIVLPPKRRFSASSTLSFWPSAWPCAVPGAAARPPAPARWTSRAIPEAKGEVKEVDGKRIQIRYKDDAFNTVTANFERWPTYAYNETKKFPPPNRIPMPAVKGDPRRGRELFMSREKAPCTGCHLIPGDDVWPAGSVGPGLSVIAGRP